jgi:hypothetical protein
MMIVGDAATMTLTTLVTLTVFPDASVAVTLMA